MERGAGGIAARIGKWVQHAWARISLGEARHPNELMIGTRLTLCFVVIVLLMVAGDVVALREFNLVRGQAWRLNQVDQQAETVLRVHANLLVLRDKLDELVATRDAQRFAVESAAFRNIFQEVVERAKAALKVPPADVKQDPTILSTLEAIESTLPAQIDAMTDLATAGDWPAVQLRLDNQVKALSFLTSSLVERVDLEVTKERAQSLDNIRRVQRRVFLVLPITACMTLLMAAMLGLKVTRSITRPLAQLDAGAQTLARGEFPNQVTVTGKDELATLGRVFNDATQRLRDLYGALRNSEARFRSLIEHSSDMIITLNREGRIGYASPSSERVVGLAPDELLGKSILEFIHVDDVSSARAALLGQIQGVSHAVEFRFLRADGSTLILEAIASKSLHETAVRGVVVNARDVTDRKRSEEALHQLSTKMLRIQEEEQRRIAREVHDSTSQEMTALTLNLGALRKSEENLSSSARRKISECLALAKRTSRQIRTFSYLLHPPMLDEFGLWAALRVFIEEFRSRSRLRVSLMITSELEGLRLDPNCEMALFRVVQEALANIHRHAGSKTASIEIELQGRFIRASVADTGHGIPAKILKEIDASSGRYMGVGIPGMTERVRQIGGHLDIQSSPRGTIVTALVPADHGESHLEEASTRAFSRGAT
jgi:PAS domain S-box-containing protein